MHDGCVTRLLGKVRNGEHGATDRLFNLVVEHMRKLARAQMHGQRDGHTLQPTALVNEAVARILAGQPINLGRNRIEFFSIASAAMRTVLVDHARRRNAQKRPTGNGRKQVPLTEDVVETDVNEPFDALVMDELMMQLRQQSERHHEIVMLRFFGGLAFREIAELLDVSTSTVEKDWRFSRLWLQKRLLEDSVH